MERSKKFEPPTRKPYEKITEALDLLNGLAEITTQSLANIAPKALLAAPTPSPTPQAAASPAKAVSRIIETKPMFSTSRPEYKGALQDPKLIEALLRITQGRKSPGPPKSKAAAAPVKNVPNVQDEGFRIIQPEQIDATIKPQSIQSSFPASRNPVLRSNKRR